MGEEVESIGEGGEMMVAGGRRVRGDFEEPGSGWRGEGIMLYVVVGEMDDDTTKQGSNAGTPRTPPQPGDPLSNSLPVVCPSPLYILHGVGRENEHYPAKAIVTLSPHLHLDGTANGLSIPGLFLCGCLTSANPRSKGNGGR